MLVFLSILHSKVAKLGILDQKHSALAYLSFLLFGFYYAVMTRVFQELVLTYGILVIILCYVFAVKLQQIYDHLRTGKLAFFSELRLRLHLRYNADCLVFLSDFNRLYGRALWAVFLVIYPENATNWIAVMKLAKKSGGNYQGSDKLSPLVKYSLYLMAVFIFFILKLVHYRTVVLTKRMYSSAKYLNSVAVHSKSIQDAKIRLKLERTISLFYSQDRPHTVTYGRHGNMSKASFGKVKKVYIFVYS